MAVRANAVMTFAVHPDWGAAYKVEDGGIRMHFLCADPGPGESSDYFILFTDTELAAITTQVQLRNAAITKLQRAIRANGIASKLDQFVGQSLTV